MSNDQVVPPSPKEGECLEQYLQRLPDEVLQSIVDDRDVSLRFCRLLQECFRGFERIEDGLEDLWKIIERTNNLESLCYFIKRLKPARQRLLDSLARNEKEILERNMLSNFSRFLGSTVDIAGTIGGLLVRDSHPSYASWAFRAATVFGLFGFATTLSEIHSSRTTLDDLMRQIEFDQEMCAPIQRWYQQSEELEVAMQKVFPFDVTNHMVAEFSDARNEEMTPVTLLATLIRSVAAQDINRLRDEGLIRNLINFSLYPASQDWCEWIVFRRHPVILDITRIAVQLQSGSSLRFALCQSIPALALADQNMSSFPVAGRMILNFLSISDSLASLLSTGNPAIVDAIRHLREHLRSELNALERIAEFIRIKKKKN